MASASTQSRVAHPHSAYRSTLSATTVRRVYDIALSEPNDGQVNMVNTEFYFLSTETTNDLMTSSTTSPEEKNDAFYKWFNHEIDINDEGQLCEG